jgi:hypothetical protein
LRAVSILAARFSKGATPVSDDRVSFAGFCGLHSMLFYAPKQFRVASFGGRLFVLLQFAHDFVDTTFFYLLLFWQRFFRAICGGVHFELYGVVREIQQLAFRSVYYNNVGEGECKQKVLGIDDNLASCLAKLAFWFSSNVVPRTLLLHKEVVK